MLTVEGGCEASTRTNSGATCVSRDSRKSSDRRSKLDWHLRCEKNSTLRRDPRSHTAGFAECPRGTRPGCAILCFGCIRNTPRSSFVVCPLRPISSIQSGRPPTASTSPVPVSILCVCRSSSNVRRTGCIYPWPLPGLYALSKCFPSGIVFSLSGLPWTPFDP